MARREPNATTYDLGHFEQWQIQAAIMEVVRTEGLASELNRPVLRELADLFAAGATVSVTRREGA